MYRKLAALVLAAVLLREFAVSGMRLVAGRAPLIGCLIQLVRLQLGGHFVGNFDVFIMGVPSVKVLQIDGRHLYFLHSVHVWVGEQNGGAAGIDSRDYLLWDNLSQGVGT